MCGIASIFLINYFYRKEIDSLSDYLNNREALICTVALTIILDVATRCVVFKKKHQALRGLLAFVKFTASIMVLLFEGFRKEIIFMKIKGFWTNYIKICREYVNWFKDYWLLYIIVSATISLILCLPIIMDMISFRKDYNCYNVKED